MTIEKLQNLLGHRSRKLDRPWEEVERNLGTALPADFREFIDRYGAGRLADFVWIFSPFAQEPNVNLLDQSSRQLAALRELTERFGELLPYPLYPEEGGLLPFGGTDNGDVLFWRTHGAPDQWTVVVNSSRSAQCELYECSMSEFLFGLVSKRIRSSLLPVDFLDQHVRYEAIA
jgi:hypothetical protein